MSEVTTQEVITALSALAPQPDPAGEFAEFIAAHLNGPSSAAVAMTAILDEGR